MPLLRDDLLASGSTEQYDEQHDQTGDHKEDGHAGVRGRLSSGVLLLHIRGLFHYGFLLHLPSSDGCSLTGRCFPLGFFVIVAHRGGAVVPAAHVQLDIQLGKAFGLLFYTILKLNIDKSNQV